MFTDDSTEPSFHAVKVKEIRKNAYSYYMDLLFSQHDMELFLKDEIEGKAIVVIDEIDKIVRSAD